MIETPRQKRVFVTLLMFLGIFGLSGSAFIFIPGAIVKIVTGIVCFVSGIGVLGYADEFIGADSLRENDGIDDEEDE